MFEILTNEIELTPVVFPDKRLEKRFNHLLNLFEKGQSSILNELAHNRSERKGGYDFFKNERISEELLKNKLYEGIQDKQSLLTEEHLLVLQDTTEYDFSWNMNRISDKSGMGILSGDFNFGFLAHTSLAMRSKDFSIIGLSDLQIWHRKEDRANADTRKLRAFEAKESFKWHVGLFNSHKRLGKAQGVTYVQDRDGDIYESIAKIAELPSAELLVRSCRDRKIELDDGNRCMLYGYLKSSKIDFSYKLKVRGDKRKNRSTRIAKLDVRCAPVKLVCPENVRKGNPQYVEVDVVWIRENPSSIPDGEKAIDWKLITTHKVFGEEYSIKQIIRWYAARWKIEEFFFITKTGAYNLEGALLETGYGLRKLGIMVMESAIKILQLRQSRDGKTNLPSSVVFNEKEEEYIERLLPSLEGKTDKLKNPHTKGSLSRAAWVIARLGGWKGYYTSRPPGMKTFKRGLDKFNTMVFAWEFNSG